MSQMLATAFSVLFPVVDPLELNDDLRRFLGSGGRSVLFGETAEEYRRGQMSDERLQIETLDKWQGFVGQARELPGDMILAADADISAVHRLQGVACALPSPAVAQAMTADELEEVCFQMALGVREAGVNLVLSPTADVLSGPNVWLQGKTLAGDPLKAAEMAAAYVRGVRRAKVGSTLKHFPGHPQLAKLPATEEAFLTSSMSALRSGWSAFRSGIEAGADAVMLGPAIVEAVTPAVSASLSADLVHILRSELGFNGLVMTIDLDHRSVQRDAPIEEVVVAALNAGADLLLISARLLPKAGVLAQAIVEAVAQGRLSVERLNAAAQAVARVAASR
jgi:beta-N-acetylhexosaminidase